MDAVHGPGKFATFGEIPLEGNKLRNRIAARPLFDLPRKPRRGTHVCNALCKIRSFSICRHGRAQRLGGSKYDQSHAQKPDRPEAVRHTPQPQTQPFPGHSVFHVAVKVKRIGRCGSSVMI